MVKLDPADMRSPVLQWFPIKKGPQDGGELLAAFELLLVRLYFIHFFHTAQAVFTINLYLNVLPIESHNLNGTEP